jgi:hypothetical protein
MESPVIVTAAAGLFGFPHVESTKRACSRKTRTAGRVVSEDILIVVVVVVLELF